MSAPVELWTNADIANELGIATNAVYNWSYYPQRSITMPEPFAVTRKGAALWTGEQAARVISEYQALQERREQRRADQERAEAAFARLVA